MPVGSDPARPAGPHFERRIVGEDPPLELPQVLRRLQAELVGEQRSALTVDLERVGLPAGAVERRASAGRAAPRATAARAPAPRGPGPSRVVLAAASRVEAPLDRVGPRLFQAVRLAGQRGNELQPG